MAERTIDRVGLLYVWERKVLVSRNIGNHVWYVPGGKREGDETDQQTLTREVLEEMDAVVEQGSIAYFGTFEAPSCNDPEAIVRMHTYRARLIGEPIVHSEIEDLAYFTHEQRRLTGPVDQLALDRLHVLGLIR